MQTPTCAARHRVNGYDDDFAHVANCRKRRPEFRRRSFMDGGAMTWHGQMPYQTEWTDETRLVAFSVSSADQGGLYCAFNTSHRPQTVTLPHWPGLVWQPVMDSGKVNMTSIQSLMCITSLAVVL